MLQGDGGEPRVEVKPLLLFLEPRDDGRIWLHSYKFPPSAYLGGDKPGAISAEAARKMRNASPDLALDYTELAASPSFSPAPYEFDASTGSFTISATVAVGSEMTFTLTETLSEVSAPV